MLNRQGKKVIGLPENYDVPIEEDVDNFNDVLSEIKLSPLAKNVFYMYYGEQLPITKIAEKINLSGARVSQLIKENIQILQNKLCA